MTRAATCACAHNTDGTTTPILCPVHADVDPCATVASVTGRRRRGTVRRGTCMHGVRADIMIAWKRVEDITSGDKLARLTTRAGRFVPTLAAIQANDDGARGVVIVTIGDHGRTTIHMRVGGTNISRTYHDDDELAVDVSTSEIDPQNPCAPTPGRETLESNPTRRTV